MSPTAPWVVGWQLADSGATSWMISLDHKDSFSSAGLGNTGEWETAQRRSARRKKKHEKVRFPQVYMSAIHAWYGFVLQRFLGALQSKVIPPFIQSSVRACSFPWDTVIPWGAQTEDSNVAHSATTPCLLQQDYKSTTIREVPRRKPPPPILPAVSCPSPALWFHATLSSLSIFLFPSLKLQPLFFYLLDLSYQYWNMSSYIPLSWENETNKQTKKHFPFYPISSQKSLHLWAVLWREGVPECFLQFKFLIQCSFCFPHVTSWALV